MAMVPYDPFRAMDLLHRDMNRFFTPLAGPFREDFNSFPRIDLYETENQIVALCEIPGIAKKDNINIDIKDNLLTISGTVNRSNEMRDENQLHRTERFNGRFQRSISLPSGARSEGAKASYRNGILEVKIPRETHGQQKSIDVEWH